MTNTMLVLEPPMLLQMTLRRISHVVFAYLHFIFVATVI